MNLPLYIARRYLFSKKGTSTNAINILSGISIFGMSVGTIALITILSVFNGFEDLILSMYNSFNPDLKIMPVIGKTFIPDQEKVITLQGMDGINTISEVVEENALFRYDDNEVIGTVKGVDEKYASISKMDSAIIDGAFVLKQDSIDYTVIGAGIDLGLSVNLNNFFSPISIYSPKRGKKVVLQPEQAFNHKMAYPSGIFAIQLEFDMKYIFVSLDFARELLDYTKEVSHLEVNIDQNASLSVLQKETKNLFGEEFKVLNRLQQDEELYRVLNSEKWIIYFILTLVLLIAAFNMIGSLSMLIMDKAHDIGILKAMGISARSVRIIFMLEGLLQVFVGYIIGAILAIIICWAQVYFKIITIEGSFVIDAYPVSLRFIDFILVFFTVLTIGFLASWFPAKRAAQQKWLFKEE